MQHPAHVHASVACPAHDRAVAALACSGCSRDAGADYALSTTSGEVLCQPCSIAEERSKATARAGRTIDEDWVGERRCGACRGGVASAGELVHHASRETSTVYEIPVLTEQIEEGSETIFSCPCGYQFSLLNRLRRIRIMLGALKAFAIGGAVALIAYLLLHRHASAAWIPLSAVPLLFFAYAARPYFDDIKLRRRHPPVVRPG